MRDVNGMTVLNQVYSRAMAESLVYELNSRDDGFIYSYKYLASAGIYNILKSEK